MPLAVAQYGARDINHRTPSDLFRDQKQKRRNGLCFNRANNQRCCSPLVIGRERSRVLVCENARKLCGRTIIFSLTFFHFFSIFIFLLLLFFFFNLALSIQTVARRVTSPYERGGELIRSWIEIIHLMRDENVFVFESIPKMTTRRPSFPQTFTGCIDYLMV